jgi:hypothetical protein
MSLPDIPLSKEDFVQLKCEDIVNKCDRRKCRHYNMPFWKKSQEAETSGNTKSQVALALLSGITSPALKPESEHEPFAYMGFINSISDAHLDALKDWTSDILDAELRARVADILWVRKRDHFMAQLAIDSYLESASHLENPEHWPSCFDRIERAIRLSRQSNQKHHFTKVVAYIEAVLDKYNGEDPLFLSAKLMELLQEYKQGNPSKYAALAEKAAHRAEAEHKWHQARSYWKVKARWHSLEKDADKERTASLLFAETYVKESEDAINKRTHPSYLVASAHLQKAIEALRRIGGTKERVNELHKILLNYQQKSRAELIPISQEINIRQFVEEAQEEVRGKDIHDALFTLAIKMGISPSVSHLRDQAQEASEKYIGRHFFPMLVMNEMGKVTAKESSIQDEMFRQAVYYQQMQAEAVIEPARYQINLEHNVKVDDFFPIVANNPFVPQGREYIYARGLHAGLIGDFLVAAHLLPPQLEHSIRCILYQRGFITSGLDDQGIQDEHNINTFFRQRESELVQIFGEDLTFDLQGLLVQKGFGSNLRNQMAHGLISYNGFFQPPVIYLWWLTLRLCCLPIYAQNHDSQTASGATSEGSEGDGECQES